MKYRSRSIGKFSEPRILPIVVLCLAAALVSLTGSWKAQVPSPADAISPADACKLPGSIAATIQTTPRSFLVSPLDIESLTQNADLIVIGRVDSIDDRGNVVRNVEGQSIEAKRMIASLSVNSVVKGQADTGKVAFEFLVPIIMSAYQDIKPSQFAMFFLQKKPDGSYAVLDSFYPFVIASSHATLIDANPLDRVVSVIGQVLENSMSSVEERRLAVKILSSARTDPATGLLRQATKDRDAVVRLQAISALLNRNDIATLDIAENILLHPVPGTEEYLLGNMSAALEGIKDPRAIPALLGLLRSSNPRTRLGTAVALRQMRSSEAIEGLVASLDDDNSKVRYQAVIGLAELTGQDHWGPAFEIFQREERPYLEHWKERAKARWNSKLVNLIPSAGASLHKPISSNESLDRQLGKLEFESITTEEALSRLLSRGGVPGGIVSKGNCAEPKKYTFKPSRSTLRNVLDTIVSTDRAHTWRIERGVINLLPFDGTSALLNLRITKFNVGNLNTVDEALDRLLAMPQVRKRIGELGLVRGYIRIGIRNLDPPGLGLDKGVRKLDVRGENVTLREALNTIVRAHGNAVWAYRERHCDGRKEFSINFLVL